MSSDDLRVGRYTVPAADLTESFTTSGGPGGQHANRSNTAVELTFDLASSEAFPADVRQKAVDALGEIVRVVASDSRSQFRNRALARRRLVERLEEAIRPRRRRRPTQPTRASRRRRLESKRRQSEKKRLRQPPEW